MSRKRKNWKFSRSCFFVVLLKRSNRFQPAIPFRGVHQPNDRALPLKDPLKCSSYSLLVRIGTSILPVASKRISRCIHVCPPSFLIPSIYALRFSKLGRHRQLVSLSYRFGWQTGGYRKTNSRSAWGMESCALRLVRKTRRPRALMGIVSRSGSKGEKRVGTRPR